MQVQSAKFNTGSIAKTSVADHTKTCQLLLAYRKGEWRNYVVKNSAKRSLLRSSACQLLKKLAEQYGSFTFDPSTATGECSNARIAGAITEAMPMLREAFSATKYRMSVTYILVAKA